MRQRDGSSVWPQTARTVPAVSTIAAENRAPVPRQEKAPRRRKEAPARSGISPHHGPALGHNIKAECESRIEGCGGNWEALACSFAKNSFDSSVSLRSCLQQCFIQLGSFDRINFRAIFIIFVFKVSGSLNTSNLFFGQRSANLTRISDFFSHHGSSLQYLP